MQQRHMELLGIVFVYNFLNRFFVGFDFLPIDLRHTTASSPYLIYDQLSKDEFQYLTKPVS